MTRPRDASADTHCQWPRGDQRAQQPPMARRELARTRVAHAPTCDHQRHVPLRSTLSGAGPLLHGCRRSIEASTHAACPCPTPAYSPLPPPQRGSPAFEQASRPNYKAFLTRPSFRINATGTTSLPVPILVRPLPLCASAPFGSTHTFTLSSFALKLNR